MAGAGAVAVVVPVGRSGAVAAVALLPLLLQAADAFSETDTWSGLEGHLLSCMQFCFERGGRTAAKAKATTSSKELERLWSCLEPDDTARQVCSQVNTALKGAVAECVTKCHKAGEDGPPAPPFNDMPAVSHPTLLRVLEVHRQCEPQDLYFDAFDYYSPEVGGTAAAALRRCGVVVLQGALPSDVASALKKHAGAFMSDKDRFLGNYYAEHVNAEDVGAARAGTPFVPNLYGGRFEVVPPSDTEVVQGHKLLAVGPVSDLLGRVWGVHPECFIMQYMCQARQTWDQQFHRDANSIEDVKVQVALQNYGEGAGPPQFLLGSHLHSTWASKMRLDFWTTLFPIFAPGGAQLGDTFVYFSSVLHRGVENTDRQFQRVSLDYVLHSTGRFFHDSERVHRKFLEESSKTKDAVLKLRRTWREAASLLDVDATTPLAWRVPGAFNETWREKLERLVRNVEERGAGRTERAFGEDYGAHQAVTYLDSAVTPEILHRLWKVTLKADLNARWNISRLSQYSKKKRPNVRCIEAIYYNAGEGTSDGGSKNRDQSIGWHSDGQTLYTTAVMLSTAGEDYEGGSFEIRRINNGEPTVLAASPGDAITWRGWYEHRVQPITSGTRRVLVVEWWTGKDVFDTHDQRGADSREGFAAARFVDPRSPYLYLLSASHHLAGGEEDEAEELLRYALAMDPGNERAYLGLGTIAKSRQQRGRAIKLLRRALQIDPEHAKTSAVLGTMLADGSETEAAEAEKHLRLAIDKKLNKEWLNNALGMLLTNRGAYAEAVSIYQQALVLSPNDPEARKRLKAAKAQLTEL